MIINTNVNESESENNDDCLIRTKKKQRKFYKPDPPSLKENLSNVPRNIIGAYLDTYAITHLYQKKKNEIKHFFFFLTMMLLMMS